MPGLRRREFIMLLAVRRTPGRSRRVRQSLHGDRGVAAAMNRWRPIAALAAIVLFSSLLAWGAEARILVCWWEYPGRMCTIIKPARQRYDRSGPATVIAERRPHARGDFGPSVASVPARPRIQGSDVSECIRPGPVRAYGCRPLKNRQPRVAGVPVPSALRDAPRLGASPDRCGRRR